MLSLKGSSGAVSSHIFPEVMETAKSICRMGLQNCTDPRVCDLSWAHETKGAINQRGGAYFILNVDKQCAQDGFFVQCTTSSRINFKLVLFSGSGEALFEQDSHVNAQSLTDATLFFTNFETGSLASQASGIASGESTDFVVKMCDSISHFALKKNTLGPGTYLVAVQCATLLSRTSFLLYAVRAHNDERLVRNVQAVDKKMLQCAKELAVFKDEYIKAKAAYKAALLKSADEEQRLSELLERREYRYFEFVDDSMKQSAMPPRSKPEGWLSRHLSLGKTAIEAIVKSPSQTALNPSSTNNNSTKSNNPSPPQKPPKPSRPQSVPNPNRSNSLSSVPFQPSSTSSGAGNGIAHLGQSKSVGAKVIERFIYTGEDDESESVAAAPAAAPVASPAAALAAPSAAASLFASVEEPHSAPSAVIATPDGLTEPGTLTSVVEEAAPSVTTSEPPIDDSAVPAVHSEDTPEEFVASEPIVANSQGETSEQDTHSPPAIVTVQQDEFCASQSLSDQGSVSSMELSPQAPAPSSQPVLKPDYGDWEGGSLQSQDSGVDSGVVVEKPGSFSSADTLTPNGHHKHVHWDEETFPSAHSSLSLLESEPTSQVESPAFAAYESDDCVSPVPVEEPEPEESREDDNASASVHAAVEEVEEVTVADIVEPASIVGATEEAVTESEPAAAVESAESEPAAAVEAAESEPAAAVEAAETVPATISEETNVESSEGTTLSSVEAAVGEETYEEEPFYVHSETFDEYVPDEPAGVDGNEDEPFFVHSETVDEYAVNAAASPAAADADVSPSLSEEEEGYEKVARTAPVATVNAIAAQEQQQEQESSLQLNDPELTSRSELSPPPIESPPLSAIPPPTIVAAPGASSLVLEDLEPGLSHSLSFSPSPTPVQPPAGKSSKNSKKKKNNKKNKRKNSVDKAPDATDATGDEGEGDNEGDAGADEGEEEGELTPAQRPTSFSVTSIDGGLVEEEVVSPPAPAVESIVDEPVSTEEVVESTQTPDTVEVSAEAAVEELPTAPSPIAVPENEPESVIGFTEDTSVLDYSIDTLPEHALDTTLNTSADFADALEPPVPRVWDAHPAAKDQTPIPMVWDLPGVAAERAEEAALQDDSTAVSVVETVEDSVKIKTEVGVETAEETSNVTVNEEVNEAVEEETAEEERPVTPTGGTSTKTSKGKNNKKKGKGKGGKAVPSVIPLIVSAPVPAVVPSPVPVTEPTKDVRAVEIAQASASESSGTASAAPVATEEKTKTATEPENVVETIVSADNASSATDMEHTEPVVPVSETRTSPERSDVDVTKNVATTMAVDPFAPISSDPFASNVVVTPTANATAAVFTPPSAASSVWDQPSAMLTPSYTPARASIYDEDEGGAPVYEPPTQIALELLQTTPAASAAPVAQSGLAAYVQQTQPQSLPHTPSWSSPAQSATQFDFTTPSPYTPVYPRTPSSKSSIKANRKYLEMPDPFAGLV